MKSRWANYLSQAFTALALLSLVSLRADAQSNWERSCTVLDGRQEFVRRTATIPSAALPSSASADSNFSPLTVVVSSGVAPYARVAAVSVELRGKGVLADTALRQKLTSDSGVATLDHLAIGQYELLIRRIRLEHLTRTIDIRGRSRDTLFVRLREMNDRCVTGTGALTSARPVKSTSPR